MFVCVSGLELSTWETGSVIQTDCWRLCVCVCVSGLELSTWETGSVIQADCWRLCVCVSGLELSTWETRSVIQTDCWRLCVCVCVCQDWSSPRGRLDLWSRLTADGCVCVCVSGLELSTWETGSVIQTDCWRLCVCVSGLELFTWETGSWRSTRSRSEGVRSPTRSTYSRRPPIRSPWRLAGRPIRVSKPLGCGVNAVMRQKGRG